MSEPPVEPPAGGQEVGWREGVLVVPERPIVPFIEGDGIGPDIWRAAQAADHKPRFPTTADTLIHAPTCTARLSTKPVRKPVRAHFNKPISTQKYL